MSTVAVDRCRVLWWMGAGLFVSGLGCVNANFTQTNGQYVVHEAASRPPVFVDRRPDRPYDSVGIIEVIAPAMASLGEVIYAASDKGREVGCDVVVERSLHQVAIETRRWRVDLFEAAPLRSLAAARRQQAPPSPWLAAGPSYQPVYMNTPPPKSREFVCGVYRDLPGAVATPESRIKPVPAGPPRCHASQLPQWKDADPPLKKKLLEYCRAPASSPDPGMPTAE